MMIRTNLSTCFALCGDDGCGSVGRGGRGRMCVRVLFFLMKRRRMLCDAMSWWSGRAGLGWHGMAGMAGMACRVVRVDGACMHTGRGNADPSAR